MRKKNDVAFVVFLGYIVLRVNLKVRVIVE